MRKWADIMIYRRCSRCGKRIPAGTACECVADHARKLQKEYDALKRDSAARAFYTGSEWRRCRAEILDLDDGVDVYAWMTRGETIPATTVHHIVPLRENWEHRTDPDNLISVSAKSHAEIEKIYGWSDRSKCEMQEKLRTMIREHRGFLNTCWRDPRLRDYDHVDEPRF